MSLKAKSPLIIDKFHALVSIESTLLDTAQCCMTWETNFLVAGVIKEEVVIVDLQG